MAPRKARSPPGPVALTGTPGTGKSSVARRLKGQLRAIEVGPLARHLRAARGSGRSVAVDLKLLNTRLRRDGSLERYDLVVGHLAHLLPIRDVIVLRCRPTVLRRRLDRARRGTKTQRQQNVVAEASDLILQEAVVRGRRIWEIDTTHRTTDQVAREVLRRVRRRGAPRIGTVDWLADPGVTELLLDRPS
jgi:adenylate kinase